MHSLIGAYARESTELSSSDVRSLTQRRFCSGGASLASSLSSDVDLRPAAAATVAATSNALPTEIVGGGCLEVSRRLLQGCAVQLTVVTGFAIPGPTGAGVCFTGYSQGACARSHPKLPALYARYSTIWLIIIGLVKPCQTKSK